MPVHLSAPVAMLAVEQLEPTRAFLCDRLGFRVTSPDATGAAGRLDVRRDDAVLLLCTDAWLQAEAGDGVLGGPYRGLIRIDVGDVEPFVPEVADADVVLPLRRDANGTHEIGVREPGGNLIMFTSRSAAPR
jgi:hypothetical protein